MAHYSKEPAEFIKHDQDKLRYDLIKPKTLKALASVLTMGAAKYSDDNWKNVDGTERYEAAMMRHFEAWRLGETVDAESGESHLVHAMCCLMFINELEQEEVNEYD